jgi:acid stress-induced BolA-like protein IbaG/YrbA
VDAGKRAVIFDKLQGVQQKVIGEGTHFRIPYIQVRFSPMLFIKIIDEIYKLS